MLNSEYEECLQTNLHEFNLAAKLCSIGTNVVKVGTKVATRLNDVEIIAKYVVKLHQDLEEHCIEVRSISFC